MQAITGGTAMQCPKGTQRTSGYRNVRNAGTEAASVLYELVYRLCMFEMPRQQPLCELPRSLSSCRPCSQGNPDSDNTALLHLKHALLKHDRLPCFDRV